jgi:hypothetical protein
MFADFLGNVSIKSLKPSQIPQNVTDPRDAQNPRRWPKNRRKLAENLSPSAVQQNGNKKYMKANQNIRILFRIELE